MITIYLIRHGKTAGNLENRYIGRTDEPLCKAGIACLRQGKAQGKYPEADVVFGSPMERCVQTAKILYPGKTMQKIGEFRECDFGIFEKKNYKELGSVPEYQAWIDSGGRLAFPQGESREAFQKRCVDGFGEMLKSVRAYTTDDLTVACVVHGGTIMSIMEKYAVPSGAYYDFQVKNGEGFVLEIDNPDSHKKNWRELWN